MIDPDSFCERSDMTVRSCAHCREIGQYRVAEGSTTNGLNLTDIDAGKVSVDAMGSIFLGPDSDGEKLIGHGFVDADEAFRRGKFGRGKHNF